MLNAKDTFVTLLNEINIVVSVDKVLNIVNSHFNVWIGNELLIGTCTGKQISIIGVSATLISFADEYIGKFCVIISR